MTSPVKSVFLDRKSRSFANIANLPVTVKAKPSLPWPREDELRILLFYFIKLNWKTWPVPVMYTCAYYECEYG